MLQYRLLFYTQNMDRDISIIIKQIMEIENCNALRAVYLIMEGKYSENEFRILQRKSKEK